MGGAGVNPDAYATLCALAGRVLCPACLQPVTMVPVSSTLVMALLWPHLAQWQRQGRWGRGWVAQRYETVPAPTRSVPCRCVLDADQRHAAHRLIAQDATVWHSAGELS